MLISYCFGSNDVCGAAGGARDVSLPSIHHQNAAVGFIFHVGPHVCVILDQFIC